MINSIRKTAHNYFLKKELKFHKPSRYVMNISDMREIGILFDATDTTKTNTINQFAESIRTQFRKVSLLGFYNFPKPAINLNFPYFHNKELNWYLEPQGYVVEEFIEKKFDVLINAYTNEVIPLEYISALSNAKYRIGLYDSAKTYCNDFMIELKENKDLGSFLEQIKHYLYIIK